MASCLVGAWPSNSVLVQQSYALLSEGLLFSVVNFLFILTFCLKKIHDLHKPRGQQKSLQQDLSVTQLILFCSASPNICHVQQFNSDFDLTEVRALV